MFAIAFDLVVKETEKHHPKSVQQAYTDIGATLAKFGFIHLQGSLYTCEKEDMANLFSAMNALKNLGWLSKSIKDIRAFRVEQWSDFTGFMKS